jgi:Peptidase family M13
MVAYINKYMLCEGVSGDEEQWRYCASDTDGVLGFAVGAMFVRETFHGDSKPSVGLQFLFRITYEPFTLRSLTNG